MAIREFRDGDLEEVYRLYCELAGLVPGEWIVGVEQFREELTKPFSNEAREVLRGDAERAMVAEEGGKIRAFACGSASGKEGRHVKPGLGMIRFVWSRAGAREACWNLIRTLDAEIRGMGVERMRAFGYWFGPAFFGMGCGQLSSAWPWIGHWLSQEGFVSSRREMGEMRMWKRMLEQRAPDPLPTGFSIERFRNEDLDHYPEELEFSFRLMKDGKLMGMSENIGNEAVVRGSGRRLIHTAGLDIAESVQGRGLGRILQRHALAAAFAAGYREAGLTTAMSNFRAQAMYRAEGYVPVDTLCEFEKASI